MRIVLPGGSGQVGTILARDLSLAGYEVVVLSRASQAVNAKVPWRVLPWDGRTQGEWVSAIDGADAVVHLGGHSVNCRYTKANRKEIMESRTISTRLVGEAIESAKRPPKVWLNASTSTIYRDARDRGMDEGSGEIIALQDSVPETYNFSVGVGLQWEAAFAEARTPSTRKVSLRTSMVMSPDRGGVFDVLLGLVRRGLGGTQGDGGQYVSWIHDQDYARAVRFLLEHEHIEGPVNMTAPKPLPNRVFMAALRAANGTSFGMPATRWMLEAGAVFLQTETELILKSRRVVPAVLLQHGFEFIFPEWPRAAQNLVRRWRSAR